MRKIERIAEHIKRRVRQGMIIEMEMSIARFKLVEKISLPYNRLQ